MPFPSPASRDGVGIDVRALGIAFPIYHVNTRELRRGLVAFAAGRIGRDPRNRMAVQALADLSFSVAPGERIGLVGGNGAGKTTLLRALAGIYEPVTGEVHVRGDVNALLDTSLGLNMDLTGRENIALRCLHAGLSRARVRDIEADVSEFAELGSFLDMPIRTYSSGMVIRLGFAIATAIRPNILLMDEWFLAGDMHFMAKARERLERLVQEAEILVISTHQMEVISAWCTRVFWMEQGRIRMEGPPDAVLPAYLAGPGEDEAA